MERPQLPTGKEVVYDDSFGIPKFFLRRTLTVAAFGGLVTAVALLEHLQNRYSQPWKILFVVCWIGWVFGPPLWFAYEYYYLYKKHGPVGSFEAFKYGQELSYRAWIGIAAVLSVIASESLK